MRRRALEAIPYALDQIVLRRISQGEFALLLAVLPATARLQITLVLNQRPSIVEIVAIAQLVVLATPAARGMTSASDYSLRSGWVLRR